MSSLRGSVLDSQQPKPFRNYLFSPLSDFLRAEATDRMRDYRVRIIRHPLRLRHGIRCGPEGLGDDRC